MSPTNRCASCNRPLRLAAASINSRRGPMLFGPVCARRQGLTLRAARKARQAAARVQRQAALIDSRQMALELEARPGVDLDAIKAAGLNSEAESMRLLASHRAQSQADFLAEVERE